MKARERIWLGVLLSVLGVLLFAAYFIRLDEIQRDFFYAIEQEDLVEMERLHERGAQLHMAWWRPEQSPIHFAVTNDKRGALKWLINQGAPLDERAYMALRPAEWALQRHRAECFRILDEAGAPFDPATPGDDTMIAAAVRTGPYAMRRVIEEGGNPNGLNRNGNPVIFDTMGYEGALEVLLDAGADINSADRDGNTFLHLIVLNMPEAASAMLPRFLELGVDPSIKNNVGDTAQEAYIEACSIRGLTPDATVVEMLESDEATL